MLMRVIAVIHLSGNDDAVDFEGVGLPNLKRHARGLTASGSLAARLRKTDLREFLSLRKAQLEHVPPQLNQGDSRGAKDGRVYRHWFAFGRLGDAEGLFWGDAGASDCGGRKWSFAARGGRGNLRLVPAPQLSGSSAFGRRAAARPNRGAEASHHWRSMRIFYWV